MAVMTGRLCLSVASLSILVLVLAFATSTPAGAAPPEQATSQPWPPKPQAAKQSSPAKRATPAVKTASAEPEFLFMSEEYVKREKIKEDALKRAMKICNGC